MERARVLIVEDETIIAKSIEAMVLDHGMDVIGICKSGEDALRLAEEGTPDIAIMDIKLHGKLTGLQTAQALQDISSIPVIYLSEHTDKATVRKAVATHPANYLAKPFTESDLLRALDIALSNAVDARSRSDHNEDFVFVKKEAKYLKVRYDEIVYVEAERSYCKIRAIDGEHKLSISMATVATQLDPGRFVKVYRSYIVNIRKVTEVTATEITVGGYKLPISDKHRAELMNRLNILH